MAEKAMDLFVNLDMHGNEVQNFVVHTAVPASPAEGMLYYNTTDKALFLYASGAWKQLAVGDSLDLYVTKAVADDATTGYVKMVGGMVPTAKIKTGITAESILKASANLTAGQFLTVTADGIASKAITNVYTYKNSVAFASLPTTGQVTGDVYNITNAFAIDGKNYPAGTNVAWDGTAWDPLGGSIDLSNYLTKDAIDNTTDALTSAETAKAPSGAKVAAALATKQDVITGPLAGLLDVATESEKGKVIVTDANGALIASDVAAGQLAKIATNETAIGNLQTAVNTKATAVSGAEGSYYKVNVNTEGVVTGGNTAMASTELSDTGDLVRDADLIKTADYVANVANDAAAPTVKAVADAIQNVTAGNVNVEGAEGKVIVGGTGGHLEASPITTTQLGYLDGMTEKVSDALGKKVDKLTTKPTASTYAKVTINAEGQVTAGITQVGNADISDLDASKLTGTIAPERLASTADVSTIDHPTLAYVDGSLKFVDRVTYKAQPITTSDWTVADGTATYTFEHDLKVLPSVTLYNDAGKVIYADVTSSATNITVAVNGAAPAATWTLVIVG